MYTKAWLRACERFFYRKNGRNFTRFALERKVATALEVLLFRLYVVGIEWLIESWGFKLCFNGRVWQNNWRHRRRGGTRKSEYHAESPR